MERSLNPMERSLNPNTIIKALEGTGITCRFVFVLESEAHRECRQVPRFSVGGPQAQLNPCVLPLDQLHEISRNDHSAINHPLGWSKLHHFIYVLEEDRDETGWEYRSDWSDGTPGEDDEQWSRVRKQGSANVRRRVWMTSVVKDEELAQAKEKVSEFLTTDTTEKSSRRIIKGELKRLESGMLGIGKKWQNRLIVLWDDKLEIFTAADADASKDARKKVDKVGEIAMKDVNCCRLYGHQLKSNNSDCVFSLRNSQNDDVVCLLDATDARAWKRWTTAISYQAATNCPKLNFPPFEYGPPSDDLSPSRVLVFGYVNMGYV